MIVWGGHLGAMIRVGGGLTQLQEKPVPYVIIDMMKLFVGVIIGAAFMFTYGGFGFFRQVGTFLGVIAGALLASWYMWRSGTGRFCGRLFWRTFRVGLTFVPHAISGVLVAFASVWLVADLESAGAAGLYGIAMSFAGLIAVPLQAISQALYPTLAGLMREATEEAKYQHIRLYMLIIAGTIFIGLGLSLFAPIVIRLLTAPEYHEAVYINAILIVAWVFEGCYLTVSQPVFVFGGGGYMTLASFGSFVVLVGLSKWLIPPMGAYGGALAMTGCYIVKMSISAFCSHKLYPLRWKLRPLIKLALAAGVLGAIGFLVVDSWPIWFSIPSKAVLAVAYVPLVVWSGIVSRDEALWGWRQVRAKMASRFGRSES